MYKIVAFVAVVLAGVFVAPVAASAVPYTPGAEIVASRTHLVPGQTTSITAGHGYFGASQSIHVAVSGVDASDWGVPSHLSSGASGGASFSLKAPSSSTGRYTVTLTSKSAAGSVVLAVTPKSGGATVSNGSLSTPGASSVANASSTTPTTTTTTTSPGLATTGTNGFSDGTQSSPVISTAAIQMIIIWALIALLALVLAFIIVTRIRRREQDAA